MKSTSIIFLIFLIFVSSPVSMSGETLTAAEKEALQRRVKDKVDEFQFYIGQLADKQSTSPQVKNNAFNLSLKLFIGECNDYEMFNPDMGCKELKSAVRMEISSKYRPTKSRKMMKLYLDNLRNTKAGTQIEITDADVVRVDNINKVGDHYECMAYFCQKYVRRLGDRIAYSDVTTKKVTVYIYAIEIPRPDGSVQTIWNALLGDVYVVSTE